MQVEGLKWLYVFQVIYAITSILLFRPLCNFVIRKLLRLYGYSYITSENMLLFFGKLPVIGALLLLLLLFALFSFLALMYIYRYISDVCHRKNVNCFSNVLSTYKDVKRLLLERQYSAVFLVIGTGLLYAMPIIFFAMKNIPSVHYVVKSFLKIKELKRMLYIGMVLFLGVMLRHTYTLSSFFEGESSFKKAKETSKKIFLRRPIRTVVGTLFWNLVSVGFCGICYTIIIGITILLILLFVSNNLHVAVFCTVQEKLYFMGFSLSLLFSITLQITGNLQFFDWVKEKSEKYEESEKISTKEKYAGTKLLNKKLFISGIILVLILDSVAIYDTIQNGKSSNWGKNGNAEITSHRGASFYAPENTIPAMENAISQATDYIEIDVQQTKDGEVVLMHDSLMKRTAGVSKHVYEMTYEEIKQLDAGKWYSPEYAGTTIPTLREVLRFCKGKCKLNIEVKASDKTPGLIEKVVDLIEEYDFTRQCVVTSVYKKALCEVKKYNKEIVTGYILSSAYGRYYLDKDIDFLSMRVTMVTERIVLLAHKYGKEVYVWTVNSKQDALYMSQLGVDNIITDRPAYIRNALYEENANRTILNLLRIGFQQGD